jgi:hypothetical protein
MERRDTLKLFGLHDLDIFARWLATYAKSRKPGQEDKLLMLGSADRYLSAIKMLMCQHGYQNNYTHPVHNNERTASIRAGMTKLFIDRHMRTGTPIMNSRETATANDLVAITLLCILSNDPTKAQLACFIMLLFHLAGRAGEVAAMPFRNVRVEVPNEFQGSGLTDFVMQFRLWRQKTAAHMQDMQDLAVFNHKDDWKKCVPFLLSYSMIMQLEEHPPEYLFSSFRPYLSEEERNGRFSYPDPEQGIGLVADLASDDEDDENMPRTPRTRRGAQARRGGSRHGNRQPGNRQQGIRQPDNHQQQGSSQQGNRQQQRSRNRSYVSSYVTDLLKELLDMASSWMEGGDEGDAATNDAGMNQTNQSASINQTNRSGLSFNPLVRCHGFKRLCANVLNSFAGLKVTWATFRCGWLMKSVHTIYEYIDKNVYNDRACGRAVAGWSVDTTLNGQEYSGRPPTIDALIPFEDRESAYSAAKATASCLFSKYVDKQYIEPEMVTYLFAVVLLNLPDFIASLADHPDNKFGTGLVRRQPGDANYQSLKVYSDLAPDDPLKVDYDKMCDHRFMRQLHQAGLHCHVDIFTMLLWSRILQKDYHLRNWHFISWEKIFESHPDDVRVRVDTRSVSEGLSQLATEAHRFSVELKSNKEQVQCLAVAAASKADVSPILFLYPSLRIIANLAFIPDFYA